jgi:hypothetical protein
VLFFHSVLRTVLTFDMQEMNTDYLKYIRHITATDIVPKIQESRVRTYLPSDWTPECGLYTLTHVSCSCCQKLLPVSCFHKNESSRYGRVYYCRPCTSQRKQCLRKKPRHYAMTVFQSLKFNSKSRNHPKPEWPTFDAFASWLSQELLRTNGRCAISKRPFTFDPDSNFFFSVERKNNNVHYTSANCVLICRLFQSGDASKGRTSGSQSHTVTGTAQWTEAKFRQVKDLRQKQETNEEKTWLDSQIQKSRDLLPMSRGQRTWMTRKGYEGSCELLSFLNLRMGDRQACAKRKRSKGRSCDVDIDVNWLLDEVESTRLRCAYSGIRMSVKPCSEWLLSVERVDDSEGYTTNNCKLVCHEFNSRYKWNKELADDIWG